MINKKNLWFLTLFSLVLVLSVYYVTMPSELLIASNNQVKETDNIEVSIEESDIISALKVEDSNDVLNEINELKQTLTNINATIEEKNIAFEALKEINNTSSKEEKIEEKIKETYNYNSFVKIDKDQVRVVVGSTEHGVESANNIMRLVQDNFDTKMYISVQFKA